MKLNKKVKIFTEDNPVILKTKIESFKENNNVVSIKQAAQNIAFVFFIENEIEKEQMKILKKIMIMRCSSETLWYKNDIGKTFGVLQEDINSYRIKSKDKEASVLKADAAVI